MAHEALKFNIQVKDYENWQPIVGCQHYGTFYMIYIKFHKVEKEGDLFNYTCSFKLQNFTGAITMGLTGYPTIKVLDDEEKKRNEIFLRENIPHFDEMTEEEQKEALNTHRIDCELTIYTKPFHFNEEIPKYTLNSIEKALEGMTLNVDCKKDIPDSTYYNEANPIESKYLNPYHYRRTGDELLELGHKRHTIDEPFSGRNHGGTLLSQCNPSRSFLI